MRRRKLNANFGIHAFSWKHIEFPKSCISNLPRLFNRANVLNCIATPPLPVSCGVKGLLHNTGIYWSKVNSLKMLYVYYMSEVSRCVVFHQPSGGTVTQHGDTEYTLC